MVTEVSLGTIPGGGSLSITSPLPTGTGGSLLIDNFQSIYTGFQSVLSLSGGTVSGNITVTNANIMILGNSSSDTFGCVVTNDVGQTGSFFAGGSATIYADYCAFYTNMANGFAVFGSTGNNLFRVAQSGAIITSHNTLDDGNGNMGITGILDMRGNTINMNVTGSGGSLLMEGAILGFGYSVSAQATGTGIVDWEGVDIFDTPTNTLTPVAWEKVTFGSTVYYRSLYQ